MSLITRMRCCVCFQSCFCCKYFATCRTEESAKKNQFFHFDKILMKYFVKAGISMKFHTFDWVRCVSYYGLKAPSPYEILRDTLNICTFYLLNAAVECALGDLIVSGMLPCIFYMSCSWSMKWLLGNRKVFSLVCNSTRTIQTAPFPL